MRYSNPIDPEWAARQVAKWWALDKITTTAALFDGEPCWLYGNIRPGGYGAVQTGGRRYVTHRVSLAAALGRDVPSDLVANHLCGDSRCVNPAHLEEATHKRNVSHGGRAGEWQRHQAASPTCKRGHAKHPDNRTGQGHCRACQRANRWVLKITRHPEGAEIDRELLTEVVSADLAAHYIRGATAPVPAVDTTYWIQRARDEMKKSRSVPGGQSDAHRALIEACDDQSNRARLIRQIREQSRLIEPGGQANRPINPEWANAYLRNPSLRSKMSKLAIAGDCVLARGPLTHGYVLVGPGRLAHRVVVTAVTGLSVEGLHIDHLCGTRACMNPRHLQALHPSVHSAAADGVGGKPIVRDKKERTECARLGHTLRGANLAVNASGHRRCIACQMAARTSRYARLSGHLEGLSREEVSLYVDTLADALYKYREAGGYTGLRGKKVYVISGKERRLSHPSDWKDLMAARRDKS